MDLTAIRGIGPTRLDAMRAMGIVSLRDLLYTLPVRYEDRTHPQPLRSLVPGQPCMVAGVVREAPKLSAFGGLTRVSATLQCEDGRLNLTWFNQEMDDCATGYAAYILELVETAKETCADPVILIEQRVDFSRWVEQGFGTSDAILIADHDVKMVKNIDKLTLFYSRVGIVIHKKNPMFFKKNVTLNDFKDSSFLSYRPMEIPPEDDFLIAICNSFGFTPNIIAHIEDFDEFMFRMEMGEGVSLIFEEAEVTSNSNLRFIPIEEDVPHKYLPMQLTRKKKNDSPLLEDLFVFARKYSNLHVKRDF